MITTNEPHLLKGVMPTNIQSDQGLYVLIRTQSSAKSSATLLKDVREVKSDFIMRTK
jgi:hypothetical protein